MKRMLVATLCLAANAAWADCSPDFRLSGTSVIEGCDPATQTCVDAAKAVYDYFEAQPDIADEFSIAIASSPWRFYDGDMRILEIGEVADVVRKGIKGHKRVVLMGSWTGAAPEAGGMSLAQRLSAALDGFPVVGQDGFLWIDKDGGLRTTQQAYTLRKAAGAYTIAEGDEVMIAMVAGWPSFHEQQFVEAGDAYGVMRAAAGHDIFSLCPEGALASFEKAAELGSPIAAYNAALMHLEKGDEAGRVAARALLERAVGLGDDKAGQKLASLPPAVASATP
jgi:hypothetical protein